MKSLITLTLSILLICFCQFSFADYIKTVSGDIIYGVITEKGENYVKIKTSFSADELVIDKTNIVDIYEEKPKGDRVQMVLVDGSRLVGEVLSSDSSSYTIKNETDGKILTVQKNEIKEILYDRPNTPTNNNNQTTTTIASATESKVDSIFNVEKEDFDSRLREYERNFIKVEPITYVNDRALSWQISSNGEIISEEDLLERTGNYELAYQIRNDRMFRNTLNLLSYFVMPAGGVLLSVGLAVSPIESLLVATGALLTLGGVGLLLFTLPIKHYLSYGKATKIAEDYNTSLRFRLELPLDAVRAFTAFQLDFEKFQPLSEFNIVTIDTHVPVINYSWLF